jgi:hypothetical protein
MANPVLEARPRNVRAAPRRRTPFFFAMSAVILSIVLVGFAPTLYLRPLFSVPPIPFYVYVHGALLTTWFVLLLAQTSLIRIGRVATHRRLGVVTVCVGVGVIVASLTVTLKFVSRVVHSGVDLDMDISVLGFGSGVPVLMLAATALWVNLASLTTFSGLLCGAVLSRRRPEIHKRLMVLASISILGPAIARISRWPGLGGDLGPFVPIVVLLLLAALVCFDWYRHRHVHRATLLGGGFVLLGIIVGSALAASDFGISIVRGMS